MKTGKIILVLFAVVFSCLFGLAAYAEDEIGQGVVTASVLNVRQGPSTSYSIIGKLYKGNVVSVLENCGGFYKISYNGGEAYISADYCDTKKSTSSRSGASLSNGEQIVEYAKKFLGTKYVYGGASPSGFDCSGFTYYVYKQFGITLNRTSSAQYSNGTYVAKSDLIPGDLVFFKNGGKSIGHVGIYVGNGNMIHSTKPGDVVKIETIMSGYYARNYVGAKRIF